MTLPEDDPRTFHAKTYPWVQPLALVFADKAGAEPTESTSPQALWIHTLSELNIVLIAAHSMDAAAALRIELKSSQNNQLLATTAQVRYSVKLPSDKWLIGCEFVPPLTTAALDGLR